MFSRRFGGSPIGGNYDQKIAGLYDLEETIGSGHFAVVKLARHVFTGERVAVKIIDKSKLDEQSKSHLYQEVRCMKLVQHPNVVRLYEVIDTHRKLYLILEWGNGGDLYDYIMRHDEGLDEKMASRYFKQIVEAIAYCHELHVCHRDLKPENVVFFKKSGQIKLTDFGFSNLFTPGSKLETSCGSLAYSAPEILIGDPYDAQAVDIWSLGVILFMLVCGRLPFNEASDSETLTMIMDVRYNISSRISNSCRDLISKMLVRDPSKRWRLEEIIRHPWLYESGNDFEPIRLPLISFEHLSTAQHNLVVEKMVEGRIGSCEEIEDALKENSYNHITATYFLLAERILKRYRSGGGSASGVGGHSRRSSGVNTPVPSGEIGGPTTSVSPTSQTLDMPEEKRPRISSSENVPKQSTTPKVTTSLSSADTMYSRFGAESDRQSSAVVPGSEITGTRLYPYSSTPSASPVPSSLGSSLLSSSVVPTISPNSANSSGSNDYIVPSNSSQSSTVASSNVDAYFHPIRKFSAIEEEETEESLSSESEDEIEKELGELSDEDDDSINLLELDSQGVIASHSVGDMLDEAVESDYDDYGSGRRYSREIRRSLEEGDIPTPVVRHLTTILDNQQHQQLQHNIVEEIIDEEETTDDNGIRSCNSENKFSKRRTNSLGTGSGSLISTVKQLFVPYSFGSTSSVPTAPTTVSPGIFPSSGSGIPRRRTPRLHTVHSSPHLLGQITEQPEHEAAEMEISENSNSNLRIKENDVSHIKLPHQISCPNPTPLTLNTENPTITHISNRSIGLLSSAKFHHKRKNYSRMRILSEPVYTKYQQNSQIKVSSASSSPRASVSVIDGSRRYSGSYLPFITSSGLRRIHRRAHRRQRRQRIHVGGAWSCSGSDASDTDDSYHNIKRAPSPSNNLLPTVKYGSSGGRLSANMMNNNDSQSTSGVTPTDIFPYSKSSYGETKFRRITQSSPGFTEIRRVIPVRSRSSSDERSSKNMSHPRRGSLEKHHSVDASSSAPSLNRSSTLNIVAHKPPQAPKTSVFRQHQTQKQDNVFYGKRRRIARPELWDKQSKWTIDKWLRWSRCETCSQRDTSLPNVHLQTRVALLATTKTTSSNQCKLSTMKYNSTGDSFLSSSQEKNSVSSSSHNPVLFSKQAEAMKNTSSPRFVLPSTRHNATVVPYISSQKTVSSVVQRRRQNDVEQMKVRSGSEPVRVMIHECHPVRDVGTQTKFSNWRPYGSYFIDADRDSFLQRVTSQLLQLKKIKTFVHTPLFSSAYHHFSSSHSNRSSFTSNNSSRTSCCNISLRAMPTASSIMNNTGSAADETKIQYSREKGKKDIKPTKISNENDKKNEDNCKVDSSLRSDSGKNTTTMNNKSDKNNRDTNTLLSTLHLTKNNLQSLSESERRLILKNPLFVRIVSDKQTLTQDGCPIARSYNENISNDSSSSVKSISATMIKQQPNGGSSGGCAHINGVDKQVIIRSTDSSTDSSVIQHTPIGRSHHRCNGKCFQEFSWFRCTRDSIECGCSKCIARGIENAGVTDLPLDSEDGGDLLHESTFVARSNFLPDEQKDGSNEVEDDSSQRSHKGNNTLKQHSNNGGGGGGGIFSKTIPWCNDCCKICSVS